MSVDLRAAFDTRVFATDASSRSCAAVVSQLPVALLKEIWRFRARRGVGQRYEVEARDGVAEASSDQSDVDSNSEEGRAQRLTPSKCTFLGKIIQNLKKILIVFTERNATKNEDIIEGSLHMKVKKWSPTPSPPSQC